MKTIETIDMNTLATITGGIDWHPWFGGFGFGLDISRRSVTDSLLSYAGMKTPTTGRLWGGLVKDGGRLDLSFSKQSVGIYLFGDYRFLHGTEVADNSA